MSETIYVRAMEVTTQAEADDMFEKLVKECMEKRPCGRTEAEQIQRSNLGYFAGYYNEETRGRVEKLYRCAHPIFGPISDNGSPTTEQALQTGIAMGKAMKGER